MKKMLNSHLFAALFMADGCLLVFHQVKGTVNNGEIEPRPYWAGSAMLTGQGIEPGLRFE
jgi:hypothetical protein